MNNIAEGKLAPSFSLMSTSGNKVSLEDFLGSKNIVLFFYPKDNTPGCTTEACEFRDYWAEFKELYTVVYGVSKDSIKSHNNFRDKYKLPYELLSDEDKTVHQLYDVIKEKSMYGKKVLGTVRSTFVINKEGILIKEFRDVKSKGHVSDVIKYIQENL